MRARRPNHPTPFANLSGSKLHALLTEDNFLGMRSLEFFSGSRASIQTQQLQFFKLYRISPNFESLLIGFSAIPCRSVTFRFNCTAARTADPKDRLPTNCRRVIHAYINAARVETDFVGEFSHRTDFFSRSLNTFRILRLVS